MSASHNPPALLTGKKIAIVGGGPSGLTLARLLQMRGGDVQVYELDATPDARNQGGALDLHEESGQVAMRQAGLLDKFYAAARPEGQSTKVLDRHGVIFVETDVRQEVEVRPEIDRGDLRKLLVEALKPGTVNWGRRLERVERTPEGRRRLIFADHPAAEADLLFGCDGTWSRVRPVLTPVKPRYAGVTFVETRISDADARHPDVADLVGPGMIMTTGDNKAMIAQRNTSGHVRVYVVLRVPERWSVECGIDFDAPSAARKDLLKLYDGWAPKVRRLLEATDDIFIPRPLYVLPADQSWPSQPDVTVLGDAAHVMPPFTGRGANLAMLDAVELAENLTSGRFAEVGAAIQAYETAMQARMERAITEVLDDQDVLIAADAPARVKDLFQRRIASILAAKSKQPAA